jgi:NAD(P)-dependent dehydrogenase (short-subunit alcohol dehydrogenase family)
MDLELTGRRAVVTGGSRGIGKAIARALAAEGCDVGLVARDPVVTEATAVELAGESGRLVVAERTPQTLAANAAARGMTVNDAEAALTAGIAIGRLVTAEEVAAVVAFLASPLSVAITGDAIAAGGGARGPIHY